MTTKIPSLATRRTACTHLTMERLYGDYQCSVCHRPSQLGWVYLCTQDDVQVPSIELVNKALKDSISAVADQRRIITVAKKPIYDLLQNSDPDDNIPKFRMPTGDLAPWMEKAIAHGYYTAEQVEILRAQRQNVVHVANAAVEQYEQEAMSEDATCLPTASASNGTTDNAAANEKNEASPLPKLKMFPYCKFRSCQACRPTFRERTWERFEDVYAKDASAIIESEKKDLYETRPLASREVMKTIGLKAPAPPAPPAHRLRRLRPGSVSDSNIRLRNTDGNLGSKSLSCDTESVHVTNPATPESQDVADAGLELDSGTSSFRGSLVRAFRGALNRSQISRSVKKQKTESESDTNIDLALWKSLNDSLLKEAASVPLPAPGSIGAP